MKTFLFTLLTALLLASTTACVVYDPYLYPEYGDAYPAYPGHPAYAAPPAVVVDPFFGLCAPWGISAYGHGYYGYYGGRGYYRGPYGGYGHQGYYRGSYGNGHGGGYYRGGGGHARHH